MNECVGVDWNWCHEESRRFRLMRNRLGDVDEVEDDEDDEDVDAREASRTRASWFLYQRILSAEMRMNSFLGWWSVVECRLDGRDRMTRAIVCEREESPCPWGGLVCWNVGVGCRGRGLLHKYTSS